MAIRPSLTIWLALVLTVGCHSTPRASRPLSMMPAAPIDDTPRGKADAPPRGKAGDSLPAAASAKLAGPGLSTAAELAKRHDGTEEASYEIPVPPAPKETLAAPKVDLPPAPAVVPVTPTPTGLPPALEAPPSPPSSPLSPPPMTAPPSPVSPFLQPLPPTPPSPAPSAPMLAPPVAVAPKPQVGAQPPLAPIAQDSKLPPPTASTPATADDDLVPQLRALHDKANARVGLMDSYTMRIRRREVVGGKQRPEELILGKFRTTPFSVYMKWIGDEGKNREMCYVLGKHEDVLHTLLAPGDMFVFGGKHFKVKPDSPLVQSNSRYPITNAGLGPAVAKFGRLVTALEKGDAKEGTARSLGKLKRPEFEDQVEGVVQILPAKYDALFPGGGQRFWFFDTKHGLPVLVVTMDHQGREVEYYCHDRIQGPAGLDDDHFNPYRLWKTATK